MIEEFAHLAVFFIYHFFKIFFFQKALPEQLV